MDYLLAPLNPLNSDDAVQDVVSQLKNQGIIEGLSNNDAKAEEESKVRLTKSK